MHGREPRDNWAITLVKRLVQVLAALNVMLLVLLVLLKATSGDDSSVDASAARNASAAPVTTEPAGDAGAQEAPAPTNDGGEATEEGAGAGSGAPPYPVPFVPTVNEVQPEAKELGSLVAYVITNYEADATIDDVLTTLPVAPDGAESLILQVQAVHHPGMWSRGTVEYAQLGGHLDGRISIIVVVRQELGFEGSNQIERTETRTMDVRLVRAESGAWLFEDIASSGGAPLDRPEDLSPLAAAVVDHERIDLPDTGVWDIYAGYIDPAVLQLMLDIADRTPYSVVVLQTGHSYHVFGTNRVSRHSVGKAVDIHLLESELVVDSHDPSSAFYALSEWLVTRDDIKEFGSPWLFPDAVVHTFTNEVHHDHLHIGVYGS